MNDRLEAVAGPDHLRVGERFQDFAEPVPILRDVAKILVGFELSEVVETALPMTDDAGAVLCSEHPGAFENDRVDAATETPFGIDPGQLEHAVLGFEILVREHEDDGVPCP